MPELPPCKYVTPHGEQCPNNEMGAGYCFWHDPKFDKSGLDLREKLEDYAHEGGFLYGLKLKRVNLAGLNLVKRGDATGFDLSWSDFYRANLKSAHLYSMVLKNGSIMKADLTDANLHCCNLENTNLLGVKLENARMDNVHVGGHLQQELAGRQAEKDGNLDMALDNFEQSEEIYRDLRKAAERQGLFDLSGKFGHKELIMRRLQYPKLSVHRITSRFVDLLCGYGEKPLNVISFSMSFILICSIFYFVIGVNAQGAFTALNFSNNTTENLNAFFSCLYFSVVTFTTLGYGDIIPVGLSRMVAAIEAFSGSFTLALFVVVFVKKMTR